MPRIAVAATAPFGADVLERLAATHDIALAADAAGHAARPRPQARAAAGEGDRRAARHPRRAAGAARRDVELDADTVVVAAYGLLIPEALLERALWLNVHPSLLPRWRGAAPVERALMAGDARTGVTIHRTIAELDAGPIAAQEAFDDRARTTTPARCTRAPPRSRRALLDDVLAREPQFAPQPDGRRRRTRRRSRPRIASSTSTRPRAELVEPRARALAAHRRARGRRRPAAHRLEGARRRRTARSSCSRCSREGGRRMPYDAYLRGLR